jgi:hypothetical protein
MMQQERQGVDAHMSTPVQLAQPDPATLLRALETIMVSCGFVQDAKGCALIDTYEQPYNGACC